MPPVFAAPGPDACPVHVIASDELDSWLSGQPQRVQAWVKAQGFTAACGQALTVPDADGGIELALAGYGSAAQRARRRFVLAEAAQKLPAGTYRIASGLPAEAAASESLGWLLTAYRFDRYKDAKGETAALQAPEAVDAAAVQSLAAAECLTRDLINTPASDMGPSELQAAASALAQEFGAEISVTLGEDLLEQNFPLIHTVGRASDRAPRLIDLRWGSSGPKLTLVGKGVCFDTGGLNLKPGNSMALMKKDMGGAANVLGLARMIMDAGLKLQLRVLIPAVENAVSGAAFRPGDVLMSRKGLTVENNNTDAEGRLVLADALALAAEGAPDLLVSMATLTGAARVAVGPDLSPFYTDHEADAAALSSSAARTADPVWRMPFHDPYEPMIEPGIADLDNAPSGGFAGSITAALFLRRFAGKTRYMHFDIYGWTPSAAPGRPRGGALQGARALFTALPDMLEL
ncbi:MULTISPECIES: leucyl aminopeptidase family protein [unclassified Leisingera]|uniref:leucyl aminopeptidase family protein n=1 Tax=unclassified Leisingera TaxID=2614906 RepID=UPI0002E7119A|nr:MULTISPECIES: leucyl aminopeptidase family protein [unclassified Leisingera]KIC22735.1 cytochrome C oxidase subunit II [Leisingera sp. ANG-S3]KIC51621.1 cytochrome C oxidase subunit II [Leisingera sp. ANG-S]KID08807.1 cytochrome C oxidase subunit II [Leisingera sp. ANG1]